MCVLLSCDVRLEWPVRAVSFSYDGKLLASASEDLFIDIADVETGELLKTQTRYSMLRVSFSSFG